MAEQIPDGFTPLVGYRVFVLHKGWLHSTTMTGYRWRPGPQKASCEREGYYFPIMGLHGTPPDPYCHCGFYCFKMPTIWANLTFTHRPPWYITARIKIWGRIQRHERGYRAEWTEIDGIYLYKLLWWRNKIVKMIADRYGVPVLRNSIIGALRAMG